MSQIATLLAGLASLVAFVFWIIKDDQWLSAEYLNLVDVYQITLAIALIILAPLLVIKPLRRLLHPCFAIARAVLTFCCWAISLLAVYMLWGSTGVTIGLILGWVGEIPMAVVACLTKGSWMMLMHILITFIGFFGCFLAEALTDPTANNNAPKEGETPDTILQASNSIWVGLALAIPGLISIAINQHLGIFIAASGLGLSAVLAVGVRKGYKIASVAYALLVIPVASKYFLSIGDFNLNGIMKLDEDAMLNLFEIVQTVIGYYALAMLLTPSALKWTWSSAKKEPKQL